MRRGTINERRMKCGQRHCPCQQDPKARHGPYFTVTQAVHGKTRTRYLSQEQLPTVRRQIEAGRQFRQQVEAYWEACEQWADAELSQAPEAAAEEAKKKGSGRASKSRSPKRYKR
jgi:hypothetical protein